MFVFISWAYCALQRSFKRWLFWSFFIIVKTCASFRAFAYHVGPLATWTLCLVSHAVCNWWRMCSVQAIVRGIRRKAIGGRQTQTQFMGGIRCYWSLLLIGMRAGRRSTRGTLEPVPEAHRTECCSQTTLRLSYRALRKVSKTHPLETSALEMQWFQTRSVGPQSIARTCAPLE